MKQFDAVERIGVAAAQLACVKELGWAFRETSASDVGIDAQIELIDGGGATGSMIGVQIKTGTSYLYKAARGLVYYGKHEDLDYWVQYSLPVIMVFHDPDEGITRWVSINDSVIERSEYGWSVIVPNLNIFGLSCKSELESLFKLNLARPILAGSLRQDQARIDAQSVLELAKEISGHLALGRWDFWVQGAAWDHLISLPEQFVDGVRVARFSASKFIFPHELQRERHAILNLVDCAAKLIDRFVPRAEYIAIQKAYLGVHAYKRIPGNPNYEKDRAAHEEWANECVWLVHELAKAANLFSDVIRQGLDRNFLLSRGRFLVSDDFLHGGVEPKYSESEKAQILDGW